MWIKINLNKPNLFTDNKYNVFGTWYMAIFLSDGRKNASPRGNL